MRLAVWNILQGGGRRIAGIVRALEEIDADVCVLSEYTSRFGPQLKRSLDERGFRHTVHTHPEGAWGGILVAARTPLTEGPSTRCPAPERWLSVTAEGLPFEIGATYIPNAERSSTAKRDYWKWLLAASKTFRGRPYIICGDLNTALPYIDENGKTISCSDAMTQLIADGWTDLWRMHHGTARESSWWSNIGNGFRLDHAFGTADCADGCAEARYEISVGGQCIVHPNRVHEGCDQTPLSDHSMLILEFV